MIKRFKIKDKYLTKVSDNELLEYMFLELKKNKYEETLYSNKVIKISDDLLKHFFKIWPYTHSIKYGEIKIDHIEKHRTLLFNFQINKIYIILGFLFGLIGGISAGSLALGTVVVVFFGGLNWLIAYWWQVSDIGTILERLRIIKLKEEGSKETIDNIKK